MRWFPFQRPGAQSVGSAQVSSYILKQKQEIQRRNDLHVLLRGFMQANYLAPLTAPAAILHLNCGTGRWAMEMAHQFPQAHVIGLDKAMPLVAVSLGQGIDQQPANCRFVQGDLLAGLPFPTASFDFVYVRLIYDLVPAATWEGLMNEIIRITQPGGWIESLEAIPVAFQQKEGMVTLIGWMNELLRLQGVEPHAALKIPNLMKQAGLMQVTTREIARPTSDLQDPATKRERQESGLRLIESLQEPVVMAKLATAQEFEEAANKARQELQISAIPGGFPIYVSFGQRP